jgi:mannose-6-phosphate isomerase-like protein (cupin superfamily)
MVDYIRHHGVLMAVIVAGSFCETGVHFFTPGEFSQQLAHMRHPMGKIIPPHVHTPVPRTVEYTQEVLIIKRGRLRVDFYDQERRYLESRILAAGDVILLAVGGHGFEVLEEIEMIEVKQGPYAGEQDKQRFPGIASDQVRVLPQLR